MKPALLYVFFDYPQDRIYSSLDDAFYFRRRKRIFNEEFDIDGAVGVELA